MHLKQVDMQNFRAIHSRQISFADVTGLPRSITVLAGPNGSGKTSILHAIVQALRGAMGYRNEDVPPASDDDVYRAEPTGQRRATATVKLQLHVVDEELESIPRVFWDTRQLRTQAGKPPLSAPDLPQGELVVTWQYPPRQRSDGSSAPVSDLWCDSPGPGGPVWLAGARWAWQGFKHRVLTQPQDLYEIGMLRFFSQSRDPRLGIGEEVQDAEREPSAEGPAGSGDKGGVPRPMTVAESLRRLGEYAHGQGLLKSDERRQWEGSLQERFARICSPKRYLGYWYDHPRYGETPLLEDRGREYPFRNAASGEQVILQYLTQFTFPRPVNNSLILIDEPELHLHPRWIRQLYRALLLLGRGNQFIMTTHSAELRQMAAEDNALVDLGQLDEEPAETAARAE